MTRFFNSPFLLGFENLEKLLERTAKHAGEGYPPYNIETVPDGTIAITLAVAGFSTDELAVTVEENQLVIRGRQTEPEDKTFLHRGIAARNFYGPSCWRKASKSNLPRWKMDCSGLIWSVRISNRVCGL